MTLAPVKVNPLALVFLIEITSGLVEAVTSGGPLLTFKEEMSECLRTYGPQIIRVPQLQIED